MRSFLHRIHAKVGDLWWYTALLFVEQHFLCRADVNVEVLGSMTCASVSPHFADNDRYTIRFGGVVH